MHIRKTNQIEVLKTIEKFIEEKGFSPTVREIASLLNIRSSSTIQEYLDRVEKKGFIERERTKPRTIKIIKEICTEL